MVETHQPEAAILSWPVERLNTYVALFNEKHDKK
jgi:hypothetical protein